MLYDFKCIDCGYVEEIKIKLKDYEEKKDRIRCRYCGEKMKRMMDFKGGFTLKGAGWHANEGTGYSITQNEMDKNGDNNKFLEEKMS